MSTYTFCLRGFFRGEASAGGPDVTKEEMKFWWEVLSWAGGGVGWLSCSLFTSVMEDESALLLEFREESAAEMYVSLYVLFSSLEKGKYHFKSRMISNINEILPES